MDDNKKRPTQEGEDLPGYPHYPASEDIMNPENGFEKVDTDLENFSRSPKATPGKADEAPFANDPTSNTGMDADEDDDLGIVRGTEADVTKDDLLALGRRDGDQDLGDDEIMRAKARPDELPDDSLDLPGTELDDANESIGEEDEENNYYSLGGDRHENLEEDNQQ
jgi:hypothetical protein